MDIALLIPGSGNVVSHILFITVYDDPKRPGPETGDTAKQHQKLLSVLRR